LYGRLLSSDGFRQDRIASSGGTAHSLNAHNRAARTGGERWLTFWPDRPESWLLEQHPVCALLLYMANGRNGLSGIGAEVKLHQHRWTNPSVRDLVGDGDPIEIVTNTARQVVMDAMDSGWTGPPFDPLVLAERLNIEVAPNADVREARTVPVGRDRFKIEFNPTRPRGRLRYSIAHEISHTFFPDCGERIRNRSIKEGIRPDEWQLEALCNIAAAELLMPIGSFEALQGESNDVNHLMEVRKQFDVSAEALFIRKVRIAAEPCFMFAASLPDTPGHNAPLRVDYTIQSPAFDRTVSFRSGIILPSISVLSECTAIGYTAKGDETWGDQRVHVECVGVPPYPGSHSPRIVGIASPQGAKAPPPQIVYLRGDALEPRGSEPAIVAHVANDKTATWHASGFAHALRRKWPAAQRDFQDWVSANRQNLALGSTRVFDLSARIAIATMVAQKGYGQSPNPRVRYGALEKCLSTLVSEAKTREASVHMPRIASGQAGGSWPIIEELISATLSRAGVRAFVYDLPAAQTPSLRNVQLPLHEATDR